MDNINPGSVVRLASHGTLMTVGLISPAKAADPNTSWDQDTPPTATCYWLGKDLNLEVGVIPLCCLRVEVKAPKET